MPDEQLAVQQLNEQRAQDEQAQKKIKKVQPVSRISGVEFALIFLVAVLKDAIDGGATISVIGIPLTSIINIAVILILWLWCIIKLQKFPTKRFITSAGIEFIPILGALPMWTFFVLSLYLEHIGLTPEVLKKLLKSPSGKT